MKKLALLSLLLPTLALASRDSNGNYTLPSGNPVTSGTTITSNWANSTLSDIQTALTDSLSRTGKGGMSVAFTLGNGSAAAPALAFTGELTTGLYWAATKDLRFSLLGNDRLRLTDTDLYYGAGTGAVTFYKIPSWFEIAMFFPGKMSNSQLLARIAFTNSTILKATLPSAVFLAGTVPTGSTTVTLKQRTGGVSTAIGTLVFAASGSTPTVTFSSDITFAAGDFLEVVGPATADATMADLSITLQARRL
jgi:hypothetical protein